MNSITALLYGSDRPGIVARVAGGFMNAEAMYYMLTNTSTVRKMFSFNGLNGNVP